MCDTGSDSAIFLCYSVNCNGVKKWMQGNTAQGILKGINPCIMGIILATGTYMLGQVLFMKQQFQMTSFLIYVILTVILTGYKKMKKKELSPIMLIVISAVLGIVLYEWF